MGNREIEDSLERLDRLTQDEAQMASAEQLKMTHSVNGKVTSVDDRVGGVEGQVEGVRDDVQDVGNKIQDVDDRVQGIDNNVRGLDDKLDQANRSLSFQSLIVIPRAKTASQGTSSEITSYDGFRPQIHPPIIT
jgi:peptidoglycan hydrolase CwlO-like protein